MNHLRKRETQQRSKVEPELVILPGAMHLSKEPGALDEVVIQALRRFLAPFGR